MDLTFQPEVVQQKIAFNV